MDPADVLAFRNLISTPTWPELGPETRPGIRPAARLKDQVHRFVADRKLPTEITQPLLAGALLWHDHLDDSHRISQDLASAHGSFLHGIMHRREPDYGNAKYWFRRVGAHLAFPEIAHQVKALMVSEGEGSNLLPRLIPKDRWDPFAFIDACEECAGRRGADARYRLLQNVQVIEFDSLLAIL